MYTLEEDQAFAIQERYSVTATPADAHREWHWNTGIPIGTPGCPQDACHPIDDFEYEDEIPATSWEPAPLVTCGHCKRKVTVEDVRVHFKFLVPIR